MKVCVYCASSPKVDRLYFEDTEALAREFVRHDVAVVYGGGATGLMGALADAMIAHGGKIRGIMPRFMNEVEWAHKGVTDIEFTETMHERKARFLLGIDAVVALAGGTGTLEELLEVITLKRLGQFDRPIVILNSNGYYDPLKMMLERCVTERFMHPRHLELWSFVNFPADVLPAIRGAAPLGDNALAIARNDI